MSDTDRIVRFAHAEHFAIPAFNIPYLPMMRPVIEAITEADSFALIDVARLEWIKFEARGPREIYDEYHRHADARHTRLHLDHIPVIDEDDQRVDVLPIMREAIDIGYESVMVDGSRLPLAENIAATRQVVELAHSADIPVEAELGAVLGHEAGPLPPYDELFESGRGFTDPDEAREFVTQTGVEWLSVAFGNIHGAISGVARLQEKPRARLDIAHFERLAEAASVPIVLHGGSGIPREYVDEAIARGIAKINIASDLRRAYEGALDSGPRQAYQAVFEATTAALERLSLRGKASSIAKYLAEQPS